MKDNLYIRILAWAFEKRDRGFSEKELSEFFNISVSGNSWVYKVFFTQNNNDRKLFEHLGYIEKTIDTPAHHTYYLNEKGLSAYIDYQELKEARKSSKIAKYIAISSLLLASIVGIIQIYLQVS